MRIKLYSLLVLCLLLCFGIPVYAQAPTDFVWLEGEAPSAHNIEVKPSDWGGGVMSGDKWLQISIDAGDVEKRVPAEGILLSYDLSTPSAGRYEIWNRIGFEFVRSAFDWRLDNGEWKTIKPEEITTDLTEIGFWAEVAWMKLGEADLTGGKHTLQIRLPRSYDAQHKVQRILYASDALCLTKGPFHPNGRYRPGDMSWQTEGDRAAAQQIFAVTVPKDAAQSAVSLKGTWQIARWDEMLVEDRTGPIAALPPADELTWKSMAVPGDRDKIHPEMTFAHRYFLRTRVNVPTELIGRAFYLHFPSVNLIGTLFINGRQVAWNKLPYAVWEVDVTKDLKPGVNEICLGIKDTYYALSPNDGKNLRYSMVLPTTFFSSNQGVSMQLDFPVWNHMENGILQEPSLVVAGKAYTSDVFAIPSVKQKTLGLEVTVRNSSAQTLSVQVQNEVVPLAGGAVEKSFAPKALQIPAGQEMLLKTSEAWTNPKLWWPDDPQQYLVVTRILADGKVIDERRTKFGFREWEWNSTHFTLNGIPWHGRADLADYGKANEAALATWRKHGQNMQRLWGETNYDGMELDKALDFFDAHGVPIRRTGIFDGEGANYGLVQQAKEGGKEVTVARRALFDNWREQLVAWAKGQRNHPSIFIWSMENEITFINANVFGLNSYTDPEMKRTAAELAALDPTRPQMTDGGNALLDESMPVYGGHYLESDFQKYPDEAYTLAETRKSGQPGHQRWPITQNKPILEGEAFYAQGNDAASLATVGGESAFVGKSESYPAMGMIAKMLSEGYRWNEQVSFHFWMGGESDLYYNSWQPVAVLCRQWDWHFGSGKTIKRTFGIFNDTRYDDPITFTWTLTVGGKKIASQSTVHKVAAGTAEKFDVPITFPEVTTRQEGNLTLTLQVKGKQVFQDIKPLSVLSYAGWTVKFRVEAVSRFHRESSSHAVAHAPADGQAVYDPAGTVVAYLKAHGVPFTRLSSLASLPLDAQILIVGKDALDAAESGSSRLAAYAAGGRTVIVLEQKNPLRYQAIPAEMPPAQNEGSIAFSEDLDHPIFHGLKQADFFVWSPGSVVYRNAYEKPSSGAKSLVQCSNGLQNTALAEVAVGKGLLLLSQLALEETLTENPVAQQLLANMVEYGLHYKLTFRPVVFTASENPLLTHAVDALGVHYTQAGDALQAISKPGSIALIAATPANLKTLAENPAKVNAFTQGGGWILLNGLTPEGLADYNKLVGFDHMIRPFQREKVTFPPIRNPLLAGLPASNVVLSSGKRIFDWQAGDYPDINAFSYVVDYEDVAPFAKSSFFAYGNIVNNFVGADGWPLIINFEIPKDGKPYAIPITFPKPQTLSEFTWIGDTNYWPQTQVNLIFEGKGKLEFKTKPDNSPQTFALSPPHAASNVTLEIAAWQPVEGKGPLVGIDNIYLKAKRSPEFYQKVKPMLNIGAMMEYPRGQGGIVLCNVKYQETEAIPDNMIKKRNILGVVLHNLKAPFSSGKSVIAGANLAYTPLDLSRQANAYRTAQGWFGDKNTTFADLPAGKHTFAGVTYNIYDFATSPVPTVVMLGGGGIPGSLPDAVKGIPVNHKADALFFLQTARLDARRNQDEIRRNRKYEMADYVITYSDGQQVKVPLYAEIDIDDYRQQSPAALPGAQVGWVKPYPGSNLSAVAYSMQWNNPRPDVPIATIDLVYGPDRRGIPALLAITAASAN